MSAPPSTRRVLLVYGHGRRGGLCQRLLQVIQAELEVCGAEVRLHDLLADGFNPVLELDADQEHAGPCDPGDDPLAHRYQEDVRWAGAYLIVHPCWWFAPPAILKGWVDRIFVHEVAIMQQPEGSPTSLLDGRRALVVQTFAAPSAIDRMFFRGITAFFWRRVVFGSAGIKRVQRLALHGVRGIEEGKLAAFESRLRTALGELCSGK